MAAALVAATGVLLAGCFSGDSSTTQAPSAPSLTVSTVKVTDMALGEALDKLALQDTESSSKDGGVCLARAARKAGMPEEALTEIVKANSDDMGAVIDGLNKVNEDDTALLASQSPREDFDACIDKAVLPNGGSPKTQSYVPPKAAARSVAGKPNLKPAHPARADHPVNSSIELTKGLVSMFTSCARDKGQRKTYAAAGQCLSTLVYDAGFNQEALYFFAGGARLGAGAIVEHLPSDKDKAIW
ncbi:hypothetical protein ACH4Y0_02845 [Streptomyces sp. NPDC020707]|uniref:hypothetical protein n=1 Tax=Streptomyces sp. NPDC020707 TaxID=3365084 RepID=UPI0037874D73